MHIQDAHCNLYAQNKIADIIDYLNKEYDLQMVNMEGGAGKYDLRAFTSISGEEIRREVTGYFVEKGEISGAEMYASINPGAVELWGIEDRALYLSNLKVYRDSLGYIKDAQKCMSGLSVVLDALKQHIFSEPLRELDEAYNSYKSGNIEFRAYLEFLMDKSEKYGVGIDQFTNLTLLRESLEREDQIDFKKANTQREILIDELKNTLSRNQIKELIAKTLDFKTRKISPKTFYEYLIGKSETIQFERERFNDLIGYAAYISVYEEVDRAAVISEMDSLEQSIKNTLFTNGSQRQLDILSKDLAIMKNIFAISITKTDYEYYLENKEEFSAAKYLEFIEEKSPEYQIDIPLDDDIYRLDGLRDRIAGFYEASFKRDDAFMDNMRFSDMPGGGKGSIIITGGFHTENLCSLFKERGISCISITPKFTIEEDYKNAYYDLLAGQTADIGVMLRAVLAKAYTLAIASKLSGLSSDVWGESGKYIFEAEAYVKTLLVEGKRVSLMASADDTEPVILGEGDDPIVDVIVPDLLLGLGLGTEEQKAGAREELARTGARPGTAQTIRMGGLVDRIAGFLMRRAPGPLARVLYAGPYFMGLYALSEIKSVFIAPFVEELIYRSILFSVSSMILQTVGYGWAWNTLYAMQVFAGFIFVSDHLDGSERGNKDFIKKTLVPFAVMLINSVALPLMIASANPLSFLLITIFIHSAANALILWLNSVFPNMRLGLADIGSARRETARQSIWNRRDLSMSEFTDPEPVVSKNISTAPVSLYTEEATGKKYLVKKAPEHTLRAELIGQRIFERAGMPVPRMRLFRSNGKAEGELFLLVEYLEGYGESDGNSLPEGFDQNETLQEAIFLDALIYNYDRTPWNMMYRGTDLSFIDFGASIFSRAQGGYKGFSPEVTEQQLESIWKDNPQFPGTPVNAAYRNVMASDAFPYVFLKALVRLTSITDTDIETIVDEAYLDVGVPEMQRRLEGRIAQLEGNESGKYTSPVETFRSILSDWGGDEREYLKHALKERRSRIIEMFQKKAIDEASKLLVKEPLFAFKKEAGIKNAFMGTIEPNLVFEGKSPSPKSVSTGTVYPPSNSMDVTADYQLGMPPGEQMMAKQEMLRRVQEEAGRIAGEDPGSAAQINAALAEINDSMNMPEFAKLQILARILAAVIGKVNKEEPDRFILHFARDMGLTSIVQNTLNQLKGMPGEDMGGVLYLNRRMMGSVYEDLHEKLGKDKNVEETVAEWFESRMSEDGDTPFKRLAEATRRSLRDTGMFDQDKVLLLDTGFVGTMPWYLYGLIRYYDRLEGREERDIKVLLVHSTASAREVSDEDIAEEDKPIISAHPGLSGMLKSNSSMLGLLEGLGNDHRHPVIFSRSKGRIEKESPENRLYFFFIGLIFQNMGIAQHLQELGIDAAADSGIDMSQLPKILDFTSQRPDGATIIDIEDMKAMGKSIMDVDFELFKHPDLFSDDQNSIIWSDEYKGLSENLIKSDEYIGFFEPPKIDLPDISDLTVKVQDSIQNDEQSIMAEEIVISSLIEKIQMLMTGFPKIKPFGFLGMFLFGTSAVLSVVLSALGIITPDIAGLILQNTALGGSALVITALAYRIFLDSINKGDISLPEYLMAGDDTLADRVSRQFGQGSGEDAGSVVIVSDIQDMDEDSFSTFIASRTDMSDDEKISAIEYFNNENTRFWMEVRDGEKFLYIKTGRVGPFRGLFTKNNIYANNALYVGSWNILYVHRNAAKSSDLALGAVLAHEKGKRAFFSSPLLSRYLGSFYAEVAGNIFELGFMLMYPMKNLFVRLPGNALWVPSLTAIPLIALSVLMAPFSAFFLLIQVFSRTLGRFMRASVVNPVVHAYFLMARTTAAVRGFLTALIPERFKPFFISPWKEELIYRGLPLVFAGLVLYAFTGHFNSAGVLLLAYPVQAYFGAKFVDKHYTGRKTFMREMGAAMVVTMINAIILPLWISGILPLTGIPIGLPLLVAANPILSFLVISALNHLFVNISVAALNRIFPGLALGYATIYGEEEAVDDGAPVKRFEIERTGSGPKLKGPEDDPYSDSDATLSNVSYLLEGLLSEKNFGFSGWGDSISEIVVYGDDREVSLRDGRLIVTENALRGYSRDSVLEKVREQLAFENAEGRTIAETIVRGTLGDISDDTAEALVFLSLVPMERVAYGGGRISAVLDGGEGYFAPEYMTRIRSLKNVIEGIGAEKAAEALRNVQGYFQLRQNIQDKLKEEFQASRDYNIKRKNDRSLEEFMGSLRQIEADPPSLERWRDQWGGMAQNDVVMAEFLYKNLYPISSKYYPGDVSPGIYAKVIETIKELTEGIPADIQERYFDRAGKIVAGLSGTEQDLWETLGYLRDYMVHMYENNEDLKSNRWNEYYLGIDRFTDLSEYLEVIRLYYFLEVSGVKTDLAPYQYLISRGSGEETLDSVPAFSKGSEGTLLFKMPPEGPDPSLQRFADWLKLVSGRNVSWRRSGAEPGSAILVAGEKLSSPVTPGPFNAGSIDAASGDDFIQRNLRKSPSRDVLGNPGDAANSMAILGRTRDFYDNVMERHPGLRGGEKLREFVRESVYFGRLTDGELSKEFFESAEREIDREIAIDPDDTEPQEKISEIELMVYLGRNLLEAGLLDDGVRVFNKVFQYLNDFMYRYDGGRIDLSKASRNMGRIGMVIEMAKDLIKNGRMEEGFNYMNFAMNFDPDSIRGVYPQTPVVGSIDHLWQEYQTSKDPVFLEKLKYLMGLWNNNIDFSAKETLGTIELMRKYQQIADASARSLPDLSASLLAEVAYLSRKTWERETLKIFQGIDRFRKDYSEAKKQDEFIRKLNEYLQHRHMDEREKGIEINGRRYSIYNVGEGYTAVGVERTEDGFRVNYEFRETEGGSVPYSLDLTREEFEAMTVPVFTDGSPSEYLDFFYGEWKFGKLMNNYSEQEKPEEIFHDTIFRETGMILYSELDPVLMAIVRRHPQQIDLVIKSLRSDLWPSKTKIDIYQVIFDNIGDKLTGAQRQELFELWEKTINAMASTYRDAYLFDGLFWEHNPKWDGISVRQIDVYFDQMSRLNSERIRFAPDPAGEAGRAMETVAAFDAAYEAFQEYREGGFGAAVTEDMPTLYRVPNVLRQDERDRSVLGRKIIEETTEALPDFAKRQARELLLGEREEGESNMDLNFIGPQPVRVMYLSKILKGLQGRAEVPEAMRETLLAESIKLADGLAERFKQDTSPFYDRMRDSSRDRGLTDVLNYAQYEYQVLEEALEYFIEAGYLTEAEALVLACDSLNRSIEELENLNERARNQRAEGGEPPENRERTRRIERMKEVYSRAFMLQRSGTAQKYLEAGNREKAEEIMLSIVSEGRKRPESFSNQHKVYLALEMAPMAISGEIKLSWFRHLTLNEDIVYKEPTAQARMISNINHLAEAIHTAEGITKEIKRQLLMQLFTRVKQELVPSQAEATRDVEMQYLALQMFSLLRLFEIVHETDDYPGLKSLILDHYSSKLRGVRYEELEHSMQGSLVYQALKRLATVIERAHPDLTQPVIVDRMLKGDDVDADLQDNLAVFFPSTVRKYIEGVDPVSLLDDYSGTLSQKVALRYYAKEVREGRSEERFDRSFIDTLRRAIDRGEALHADLEVLLRAFIAKERSGVVAKILESLGERARASDVFPMMSDFRDNAPVTMLLRETLSDLADAGQDEDLRSFCLDGLLYSRTKEDSARSFNLYRDIFLIPGLNDDEKERIFLKMLGTGKEFNDKLSENIRAYYFREICYDRWSGYSDERRKILRSGASAERSQFFDDITRFIEVKNRAVGTLERAPGITLAHRPSQGFSGWKKIDELNDLLGVYLEYPDLRADFLEEFEAICGTQEEAFRSENFTTRIVSPESWEKVDKRLIENLHELDRILMRVPERALSDPRSPFYLVFRMRFARLDGRKRENILRDFRSERFSDQFSIEEVMRKVIVQNGVGDIKFGQILSVRDDLITSDSYRTELAKLKDNVPPLSFGDDRSTDSWGHRDKEPLFTIKKALEDAFPDAGGKVVAERVPGSGVAKRDGALVWEDPGLDGLRLSEGVVFYRFWEEPIAVASIGQVHRAVIHDGEKFVDVIVKVLKPNAPGEVEEGRLAWLDIARFIEENPDRFPGVQNPTHHVDTIFDEITKELDYSLELANVAEIKKVVDGKTVTVPDMYDSHSAKSVLTMGRAAGVPISKTPRAFRSRVVRVFMETMMRQMFGEGVYHADPHDKNIFVDVVTTDRSENVLMTMIDLGMIGRITREDRERFFRLVLRLYQKDVDGILEELRGMGDSTGEASDELKEKIRAILSDEDKGVVSIDSLLKRSGADRAFDRDGEVILVFGDVEASLGATASIKGDNVVFSEGIAEPDIAGLAFPEEVSGKIDILRKIFTDSRKPFSKQIQAIFEEASKSGISVGAQYTIVIKSIITAEGVARELDSEYDSTIDLAPVILPYLWGITSWDERMDILVRMYSAYGEDRDFVGKVVGKVWQASTIDEKKVILSMFLGKVRPEIMGGAGAAAASLSGAAESVADGQMVKGILDAVTGAVNTLNNMGGGATRDSTPEDLAEGQTQRAAGMAKVRAGLMEVFPEVFPVIWKDTSTEDKLELVSAVLRDESFSVSEMRDYLVMAWENSDKSEMKELALSLISDRELAGLTLELAKEDLFSRDILKDILFMLVTDNTAVQDAALRKMAEDPGLRNRLTELMGMSIWPGLDLEEKEKLVVNVARVFGTKGALEGLFSIGNELWRNISDDEKVELMYAFTALMWRDRELRLPMIYFFYRATTFVEKILLLARLTARSITGKPLLEEESGVEAAPEEEAGADKVRGIPAAGRTAVPASSGAGYFGLSYDLPLEDTMSFESRANLEALLDRKIKTIDDVEMVAKFLRENSALGRYLMDERDRLQIPFTLDFISGQSSSFGNLVENLTDRNNKKTYFIGFVLGITFREAMQHMIHELVHSVPLIEGIEYPQLTPEFIKNNSEEAIKDRILEIFAFEESLAFSSNMQLFEELLSDFEEGPGVDVEWDQVWDTTPGGEEFRFLPGIMRLWQGTVENEGFEGLVSRIRQYYPPFAGLGTMNYDASAAMYAKFFKDNQDDLDSAVVDEDAGRMDKITKKLNVFNNFSAVQMMLRALADPSGERTLDRDTLQRLARSDELDRFIEEMMEDVDPEDMPVLLKTLPLQGIVPDGVMGILDQMAASAGAKDLIDRLGPLNTPESRDAAKSFVAGEVRKMINKNIGLLSGPGVTGNIAKGIENEDQVKREISAESRSVARQASRTVAEVRRRATEKHIINGKEMPGILDRFNANRENIANMLRASVRIRLAEDLEMDPLEVPEERIEIEIEKQLERVEEALSDPARSFVWFRTRVLGREHYLLGYESGLAVDLVEYLRGAEDPSLLDEYIFHEALERTGLDHYQIIALTTHVFGRGSYEADFKSTPGLTPLGGALRAFIDSAADTSAAAEKAAKEDSAREEKLRQALLERNEAARNALNDLCQGCMDWLITPTSIEAEAAKSAIDSSAGRLIDRRYGSMTRLSGYKYSSKMSEDTLDDNLRGTFEAVMAEMLPYMADTRALPRALAFLPSDVMSRAREILDKIAIEGAVYELPLKGLSGDALKALADKIALVKEDAIPDNGMIEEVDHVVAGKVLLNYQRYDDGDLTESRANILEIRRRAADYLKLIVSDPDRITPEAVDLILKGELSLNIIKPVDYENIREWKEAQDQVLRSL